MKNELWGKIHTSILEYMELIVEISDREGYRIRPKMIEGEEIYDYVDTTNFKNVEELNRWEEATGFECEMTRAEEKIRKNEKIYASLSIPIHFNIDLNENFEVRQKIYSLNKKSRELEQLIKMIIKSDDVEVTVEELRANGATLVLKSLSPLFESERKELYDNYLDIVEEFKDEDFKYCYRLKT